MNKTRLSRKSNWPTSNLGHSDSVCCDNVQTTLFNVLWKFLYVVLKKLILFPVVKVLWTSVKIWQSYHYNSHVFGHSKWLKLKLNLKTAITPVRMNKHNSEYLACEQQHIVIAPWFKQPYSATGAGITCVMNLVIVRWFGTDDATKTVSLGSTEWSVKASDFVAVHLTPLTVQHSNAVTATTHECCHWQLNEMFVNVHQVGVNVTIMYTSRP